MKENQFGFEYSWKDLEPIRTVAVVTVACQIAGALIGLWNDRYSEWFSNLWAGGALGTFPGFALGFLVQWRKQPEAISQNKVMVRRLGLVAAFLTLIAFVFPFK